MLRRVYHQTNRLYFFVIAAPLALAMMALLAWIAARMVAEREWGYALFCVALDLVGAYFLRRRYLRFR